MSSQKVANNPLGSYAVAVDTDNNYTQRQAVGIDIGTVSGGVWTASRVSALNPLPITGSVSPSSPTLPSTPTTTQTSCTSATSTQILAANSSRKSGTFLTNPASGVTFWVKEGGTAVVGEGAPLFYGGSYLVVSTAAVRVIQSSGSPANINAVEVV